MSKTSIEKAVGLLKKGNVVAFPTETVYGLGADAWNPSAVKKVFEAKGRPPDNPLIVHISTPAMADSFAADIPSGARALMNAFWPGPLTLIFKKKPEVLDIITGGLSTVALRWPDHPISQDLIARSGPLVAPSANTSGRPSPTKPKHIYEDLGDEFPVIEAGETQIGLESTVLDVSEEPYKIYRPGATGKDEIEEITGQKVREGASHPTKGTAKSPGTKYTHYAPKAAVRWLKKGEETRSRKILYLMHTQQTPRDPGHVVHYGGDYQQMAHELFDRFRQADLKKYDAVLIEPFSRKMIRNHTLAGAIQNRISKAITG